MHIESDCLTEAGIEFIEQERASLVREQGAQLIEHLTTVFGCQDELSLKVASRSLCWAHILFARRNFSKEGYSEYVKFINQTLSENLLQELDYIADIKIC